MAQELFPVECLIEHPLDWENSPSIQTRNIRPVRKLRIIFKTFAFIPRDSSLYSNLLWGTRSKAFLKIKIKNINRIALINDIYNTIHSF